MGGGFIEGGDGLFRLAQALASNNQHKENDDLMQWIETATVDDLRLAFPVLLNWCRNSAKKAAKAAASKANNESSKMPDDENSEPIILKTTTTIEDVAQRIAKVLEDAIDYDAATASGDDDERKKNSIASLQMALAGYLHTNHDKMRKVPVVAELERRTKAKVTLDRAATNTLNMVNAASSSSLSISQYIKPEEEPTSFRGWGIPQINIDLGLGLQSSPADVCKKFIRDEKPLKHPFTGENVGFMKVKKVFPSKRKPVWIEYFSDDDRPLKPDVLAKQGDDLRNDASVTSVSKLCECIWAAAPIEWTLGVPPTVCAYDVLVTAPDAGYLEMVPGKNFLDLSQKTGGKTGWEDVDVRKLASSLVGSYVVNFILGVRDRHEDNMMVVGDLQDDPRMMQIDFGYVLNEFPGGVHFDMPRLTMPIALVDRFNAEPGRKTGETLMENLQHDMLAAYLVLRRHSDQVIPFCAHLMSSSYDYKFVASVLKGKHVFRKGRSETKVIQWISTKLTTQWAHFYFRREIKQGMVSGYYKFVETIENINNDGDADEKPAPKRSIISFFQSLDFGTGSKSNDLSQGSFASDDESDDESGPTTQRGGVPPREIDMSELNERVTNAMKLQKEVSSAMISASEKHGKIDFRKSDETHEALDE
mmetsp:Transcript_11854/g.28087  ORF Transcript_11854/g.28087 Transcript_11854/m.28087 type:complete len:646 (+) Transcript_11854:186-2123(+)